MEAVKSSKAETARGRIVAAARGWIGTPYAHQASIRGAGCDCLGLVRGVWREVMGEEPQPMPAYSPDWAEAGLEETLIGAARRHLVEVPVEVFDAGDVLIFRWRRHLPAKHAGIATARTSMIHAQEGAAVCEVPLSRWWFRHLAGAYRFPLSSAH
jgi:NlpC/P60 family putative phage cell wall peptidase